jgi:hypothetical protein
MKASDRRFRQRFDLRVPIKIRNVDSPSTTEQLIESTDISARGLYFSTDAPFDIGTRVEMFLIMPMAISGQDARTWLCTGRVVRVQPAGAPETKPGNGIEILYYEVIDGSRVDAAAAGKSKL